MIHVSIILGSFHSMADAKLSDLLLIFHAEYKISQTYKITTIAMNYIFDTGKYKLPFHCT